MFIERRVNETTKVVELWECEWEKEGRKAARKVFLQKIGEEARVPSYSDESLSEEQAICWSYGRTLGNIAVFSTSLIGSFPDDAGTDAQLPCQFVDAGKFRHGAVRWWCRTHQTHWGTKGDKEAFRQHGEMRCSNHAQPMHYVVTPLVVAPDDYAEIGIWCSLPAAKATGPIEPRAPKIHVHARAKAGGAKQIDDDFDAISLDYHQNLGLFTDRKITRVNITPPAAFEFVRALEEGRETDCIDCSHCGYPHLDLGSFAIEPHRKHFCGNCGRDSTWSKEPIVSTPLKPLHDQLAANAHYESPERHLDLDRVLRENGDAEYEIWASTPAIIWTAARPQETGIHVHTWKPDGTWLVNETFAEVILNGRQLERGALLAEMFANVFI